MNPLLIQFYLMGLCWLWITGLVIFPLAAGWYYRMRMVARPTVEIRFEIPLPPPALPAGPHSRSTVITLEKTAGRIQMNSDIITRLLNDPSYAIYHD
jgi:hypothetical protein